MSTRTIKECQDLAKAWLDGKKKQVIDELGGEPTERFLRDFSGWRGDPHKVYTSAEKYTVSLPATDTPGAGVKVPVPKPKPKRSK